MAAMPRRSASRARAATSGSLTTTRSGGTRPVSTTRAAIAPPILPPPMIASLRTSIQAPPSDSSARLILRHGFYPRRLHAAGRAALYTGSGAGRDAGQTGTVQRGAANGTEALPRCRVAVRRKAARGERCATQRFPERSPAACAERRRRCNVVPEFRNEGLTDFEVPANREAFAAALARVASEAGREYPLRVGGESLTT